MTELRVAVPAETDGTLDSRISAHFGHAPVFVIATVRDGEIVDIDVVRNLGHTSCSGPIDMLIQRDVNVLLTAGMGMRPYAYSQQVGLFVAKAAGTSVREAVENYVQGKTEVMGTDALCEGGGAHRAH